MGALYSDFRGSVIRPPPGACSLIAVGSLLPTNVSLPCQFTVQIAADAYFHVRNASEHGALSVLKVMFKYRDDLHVQGIGLQRIAGSLLEGERLTKLAVVGFSFIVSETVLEFKGHRRQRLFSP